MAALLLLLAGWCTARVMLWETPFFAPLEVLADSITRPGASAPSPIDEAPSELVPFAKPVTRPAPRPREPMWIVPAGGGSSPAGASEMPPPWALVANPDPEVGPVPPRIAGGHMLLLAAAFAQLEVPPELAVLVPRAPAKAALPAVFPRLIGDTGRAPAKRWSGDAWLLLRHDTTTPVTSGRGSYGQSQVGAVLRYRIAPSSGHRPAAYVRGSTALGEADRPEVAAGLTGRPVPGVPVALAAEARAARFYYGTAVRPAVFAYSEFPPLELPAGARAEAYFQGGYIGGRFATAFVDGQLRVDRQLARLGTAELRAGGGAWGGAQSGAKRLDVGPGATIAVALGGAPVRMSADWRFRVAGDANPSSGPALTISTGF